MWPNGAIIDYVTRVIAKEGAMNIRTFYSFFMNIGLRLLSTEETTIQARCNLTTPEIYTARMNRQLEDLQELYILLHINSSHWIFLPV